jgi:hypothetical protein
MKKQKDEIKDIKKKLDWLIQKAIKEGTKKDVKRELNG